MDTGRTLQLAFRGRRRREVEAGSPARSGGRSRSTALAGPARPSGGCSRAGCARRLQRRTGRNSQATGGLAGHGRPKGTLQRLERKPAPLRHGTLSAALWTPSEGFNAAGGALLERCENLEAKLLIVDPAAAAFGGEKTDNYHCSRFALDLDGWARKSGCTVLVVDHPPTRKWDIDSVPSAFASLPRTVLSLQAWDRRATPGRPKQAGHLTLEKSNYSSLGGTRIRIETEEPKSGRDWSGWWTAQARYDG